MGNQWSFPDSPDCAVFSTLGVVNDKHPILLVTHDSEDGAWQFLDSFSPPLDDAVVVGLEEIVELDRSLIELADLPLGWQASRSSSAFPWVRAKAGLPPKE